MTLRFANRHFNEYTGWIFIAYIPIFVFACDGLPKSKNHHIRIIWVFIASMQRFTEAERNRVGNKSVGLIKTDNDG